MLTLPLGRHALFPLQLALPELRPSESIAGDRRTPYGTLICHPINSEKFQHAHSCQWQVFVGDVVMLKDPENPDDYLVRRFAAIEGYEMASRDEKHEPFVLEKDQCS
ncbi:hypothetical protein J5N97_028859 [Dioscorea zingiberensis]|uniref:Uncharacterized protein n=1 Tax=Dioscorea zingiberensis TaxID=325984 RepID=A0A9D5H5D0_9LILI|nr:hypothetical protein J5N97_028859 [Dioscorea zingiberensis]